MKDFRTIISPQKSPFTISHKDRIVSIGSCFSENIGKKFSDYKFSININPFGQQYNPHSIANAIHRLLESKPYTEKDLVFHDELYHSFDHHGSFSRNSVEETLNVVNQNLEQASQDLKTATVLFLTFGTSHVFSLKESGSVVSNCHKLSGNNFDRKLMKPAEIVDVLDNAFERLRKINPSLKIILSVSPVRYFAFGHHENTVSKSHLFSAIQELQEPHPEYFYFPAYELVMDDLRDYRFFAEDMLHPNYQATNYVWEKLCGAMIDKGTLQVMAEIDEILLAAKHKARNPTSEAHKKFVKKNLEKIEMLKKSFGLSFTEEERALASFV
jgi:hypothetical protein